MGRLYAISGDSGGSAGVCLEGRIIGRRPIDLVSTGETPGSAVRWSPKGDWIAYLKAKSPGAELRLVSPDGQKQRTLLEKSYDAWCFDGAGTSIYGVRRGEDRKWSLWALDVAGGAERKVSQLQLGPQIQVTHISMHPDGKRLLVTIRMEASDIWMIEGISQ